MTARAREEQRRAGRRAVRQRGHDQDARVEPAGQARAARPRAGRRPGLRERARHAGRLSRVSVVRQRAPRPKICASEERGRALRAMTGRPAAGDSSRHAAPPPQGASHMTRPVEVRDLSKRFGGVAAVKHLSFDIEAGRVTGFLGPNGAGKSTTLRALLGLVRPSSGSATFGGVRATRSSIGPAPASARCSRTPRSTPAAAPATTCGSSPLTGRASGEPRRRGPRRRRPHRRRRPAREGLLDGHAPAPGDRRRAARRPAGADPRRADQRPRPAGHQLAARPAARAGRRRRAPCSSPATCWPRSRSRSTTSS